MTRSILLFALACVSAALLLDLAQAATPCKQKTFNHNSFVCVCDEGHCDTVDPVQRSDKGVIQIFESTRERKRLEKREQRFNENNGDYPGPKWEVSIEAGFKFQTLLGFGGAFSDAAVLGISSLSQNLQDKLLNSYYGSQGIDYSISRVVIGGCDFSNRGYTYADQPFDWDLKQWSFVPEDSLKIQYITKAKQLAGSTNGLNLYASSWGPPAWLKSNGEINHGGNLNEEAGSRTWETYAKYLIKFFDGYKAAGISFWGMTVQNEVQVWDPWFPWNTCGFTGSMERDFVKMHLGPNLERAGYFDKNNRSAFNIMIYDHNRDGLPGYIQDELTDPEASSYIAGAATHWYANSQANAKNLDDLHNLYPDKFILATEACEFFSEEDKTGMGDWGIGQKYAHNILRDLNHYTIGWTDWNLVLDMDGKPNWANNGQSAPIHVNPAAGEFYKNPSFYAMGHFSKFLPPNSQRVKMTPELVDNDKFQVGAFRRPDGGIVVVAINSWDEPQALTIIHRDGNLGEAKLSVEPHSFNTYVYYE